MNQLVNRFMPCQGKTACRDDGLICLTCGRSLAEIEQLRKLMDGLATMAIQHGYTNLDEYADYIARKVVKLIQHRRGA